jgi:hypothetical protein
MGQWRRGRTQATLKTFRFMKLMRQFANLPRRAKASLFIAFSALLACRLALWVVPFRILRRAIDQSPSVRPILRSFPTEQLRWAILAGARRIPLASCLTQAIALHCLMARAGRRSQLRIGVAKDAAGVFQSHAWLEYQGNILVGGHEDLTRYVAMDTFAAQERAG